MATPEYIEQLESALIDVLDGQSRWDEIQYLTGCSEERSKEIEDFYTKRVFINYQKKHNINPL